MSDLVTKGEFAQMIGVSPGRVSQMIAAGQIDAAAIEGEGQRAKIRPDVAKDQLKRRLDVGQRTGNGLNTRLEDERRSPPGHVTPAAPSSRRDLFDDAIRAEKLRGLRAANRRAAEAERERAGLYVRADTTSAAMAKLAGALMNVVDGGLGDLSQALAAKFKLPARDVLHLLRSEFRVIREKAAARAMQDAAAMPAFVDDEIADASDPAQGEA